MGTPPLPPSTQRPAESSDTEKLLAFLREERKSVQESFKWYVSWLAAAAVFIVGIGAFIGYRSLDDYKSQLKTQADVATRQAIDKTEGEVRRQMQAKFGEPQLQKLIKEQTQAAVHDAIESEIHSQLSDIRRNVSEEVKSQAAALRKIEASISLIQIDPEQGEKRIGGKGTLEICSITRDKYSNQAAGLRDDLARMFAISHPQQPCEGGGPQERVTEGILITYGDKSGEHIGYDIAKELEKYLREKHLNVRMADSGYHTQASLEIQIGKNLIRGEMK